MFRDARRPAEAAESGRTDEDDAAEALRMLCGGGDDILPRQRERDDIDGGLPGCIAASRMRSSCSP